MLRNVCDRCNAVISGNPQTKDYPEALLVIDDEIAVMYENLCPTCKSKLIAAVKAFDSGQREQIPAKPAIEREPADAESVANNVSHGRNPERGHVSETEVHELVIDENPPLDDDTADDAEKSERPLANQVVKQYPINLPKHD